MYSWSSNIHPSITSSPFALKTLFPVQEPLCKCRMKLLLVIALQLQLQINSILVLHLAWPLTLEGLVFLWLGTIISTARRIFNLAWSIFLLLATPYFIPIVFPGAFRHSGVSVALIASISRGLLHLNVPSLSWLWFLVSFFAPYTCVMG